MKIETAKRIEQAWDSIEENEPDISTERLMQMTADIAKVQYGDVVTGLAMMHRLKEKKS